MNTSGNFAVTLPARPRNSPTASASSSRAASSGKSPPLREIESGWDTDPTSVEGQSPSTDGDTDSTLGEDQSTCTETLRSSLLESIKENGRGYHKYHDGRYILPEDEREQERLDMQHEMFLRTLDNKLILAPVDVEVYEALDLGTGTGIWAIDYADRHPGTNVLGVDLSPIQPTSVPPNCKFEVDDFENEWTFPRKFDLIHGRMMLGSCNDFPKLFRQAYDSLNPGGWFEIQDLSLPFQCEDGTLTGTTLESWHRDFMAACMVIGRDTEWTHSYKRWLEEAGFEVVEELVYKWPIGPWPKDRHLKELGAWNLVNMLDGLEAFTHRLFTKALGKQMEEVELTLTEVRKDLKSRKIHAIWPIHVVYGKKPVK